MLAVSAGRGNPNRAHPLAFGGRRLLFASPCLLPRRRRPILPARPAGRRLSETPKFPWSRPRLAAPNRVFNLVPCANEFEKEFARFPHDAADVKRFAKLPEQFSFAMEYTDAVGNLRYYEPDFVAVVADGAHYFLETKGLEDVNVAFRCRAAHLWCENATRLIGTPWTYWKVRQTEYTGLQPTTFGDLLLAPG